MREYQITTALVAAYIGCRDTDVYTIQSPSLKAVPLNYSQDYLTKIMLDRITQAKKKPQKNLASLVK
jgi:hypothetical protein